MTDSEIIEAVAGLDGFERQTGSVFTCIAGVSAINEAQLPDYLNSIDAVRNVVLNQDGRTQRVFVMKLQLHAPKNSYFHEWTARDWCVALLRAAEKWKD